jgi:hypothetical protein
MRIVLFFKIFWARIVRAYQMDRALVGHRKLFKKAEREMNSWRHPKHA